MNIIESFVTRNDCYKKGEKITVKGLMLHSVGAAQPKASVFVNNFNTSGLGKCVHGFIDGNDGAIHQTLPWDYRAWHAGGSANDTHIGVEMCESGWLIYSSGGNFTCYNLPEARATAKRTYDAAVELFAFLCKKFNLNPLEDGVIISHKEGGKRGIASNHGDPEHLWSQLGTGYTMNTFRQAVKAAMGGVTSNDTEVKTEEKSKGESTVNIELYVSRFDSKGEQVKNLQRLLIAKGYTLKKYGADGDFGNETETAVKAFQKDNNLTVDGIVGQNTWNKLLKG